MTEKKDTNKARLGRLEDAFITLNKEMGVVQGELKWIKWILIGGFAGQFFIKILGG